MLSAVTSSRGAASDTTSEIRSAASFATAGPTCVYLSAVKPVELCPSRRLTTFIATFVPTEPGPGLSTVHPRHNDPGQDSSSGSIVRPG